jgi:hypothetical protein
MTGKALAVRVALAIGVWLGSGCNAILGPDNVDANWRIYDSPHFSLYVRPGSFAEQNHVRLTEVLEDQYATTVAALGLNYSGRITAFLYTSAGDARLESDHSGVAYADTEAMRAVSVPPLDGRLYSLLSHEANHVIQQNALGRPGTSFMNEGLPSAVVSTRFHPFGSAFLYQWTASHASSIPPLGMLADDEKWDASDVAYKASASFLAYLIERGGPGPIKQIYQVGSRAFPTRVREVYGRTLEDLEREWRDFCSARR